MTSRMPRSMLLVIAGLMCAAAPLAAIGADTVLVEDISALPPVTEQYSRPQSTFHDWSEANAEARKVLLAWESEPVTIAWTRIQLGRHVKHKVSPTLAARGLALTHVAMSDAFQLAEAEKLDTRLAVSAAAASVLGYLFPSEERAFERISFTLASKLLNEESPEILVGEGARSLNLGRLVGLQIVAYAKEDGADYGWNGKAQQYYGEGRFYGPGAWEPTPPYFYYPPAEPFAPFWKPWRLKSADQFRPAPPAFGSEQFRNDLEEVIRIGQSLTPDQLKIAKFWVDGHGSVTPPGHWNEIAISEVLAANLDSQMTSRLFADLNMAMADAFIAAWDAKYHYWTIRPMTAAKQLLNIDFKPAILTPPFPGYVSGHAATSGAGSEVLALYLIERGDDIRAMADKAAMSRLYGGIHFRHDNEDGLMLGRLIAHNFLPVGQNRRTLRNKEVANRSCSR